MARRPVTLVAAVVLLTALAAVPALAGGGGGDAGRCAGFTEGEQVLLRDGCLDGIAHFLAEGSDLEVVNEGEMAHDYTAIDRSFRTGQLQPGERATVEAPAAGVHRVYCSLHASPKGHGMAGILVVGDHTPETVAAAGGGEAAASGEAAAGADRDTAEAGADAGAAAAAGLGGSGNPPSGEPAGSAITAGGWLAAGTAALAALLAGLVVARRRAGAGASPTLATDRG